MSRLAASLLTLLLTLSCGVTTSAQKKAETPRRKFTRDIPRDEWVPTRFKDIDTVAKRVRLPTLRTQLRDGELELRVWELDNLSWPEGFRMRRTREGWSASFFDSAEIDGRDTGYERRLAEPRSGWEGAWNRLVNLGVLELPDGEARRCSSPGIRDGHSYVVETNVGRAYRTYHYSNPEVGWCAEARRLASVVWAIVDEFGLTQIKPDDEFTLPTPRRP